MTPARQAEPPQSALVLQSGVKLQLHRQWPRNGLTVDMNSGCAGAVEGAAGLQMA